MVSLNTTGVYTDVNSRVVRPVFTIAFFLLTWLIGFIAAFFLSWRNQSKLLHGRKKAIPLNHLSSWLSEPDALWYLWYTRRLPGGRYGLLMVSTGLFTLLSHIFVGLYITSTATADRCTFIQGIVLETWNVSTLPASQWPAADMAVNAQIYSVRNGGLTGIYEKVNADSASLADPQFAARSEDVIGGWTCTSTGSQDFPSDATIHDMATSLQSTDDLYTAAIDNATERLITADRALMSLLIWSASVDNSITPGPWDVKASIGFRDTEYESFTMENTYCHCALEGPLKDLLTYIPSQETLTEWKERLYGLLQEIDNAGGNRGEYTGILELGLNALTMAAGTGNKANRLLTETLADPKYGCIAIRTLIQYPIFIALAILLLMLSLVTVASIFRRVTSLRSGRSLVKDMPSDLVSWQVATLRDIFHDDTIQPKDLKQYSYGWIVQDQKVGYMKNGAPWVSIPTIALASEFEPAVMINTVQARQSLSTPLLMNNGGPQMSTPSLQTPMTGFTPPVVQSPRSYFG